VAKKSTKKSNGRTYSRKASEEVEEVMHERKRGTLRSGSGQKVKSRKQAIAIGLSEAREAGARVPENPNEPKSRGRKKSTRKTTTKTARKTSRKK